MNGIEISRRYYLSAVAPGLAATPHAAALLGPGSEVLVARARGGDRYGEQPARGGHQ